LEFEIADIFQRLPFRDNEFDLVHLETMLFFILPTQLNFLIDEMIRVTKPNGYIEFAETHISKSEKTSENFGRLICGCK
jgi:ubiquinone/menaquinone biosynthesis C-methylase UbiE